MSSTSINVSDGSSRRRTVAGVPLSVFIGTFLIMVLDGFDLQLIGFAAPALIAELGIARSALGPALAASVIGMSIGAVAIGPVGDRWGRRPALLVSAAVVRRDDLADGHRDERRDARAVAIPDRHRTRRGVARRRCADGGVHAGAPSQPARGDVAARRAGRRNRRCGARGRNHPGAGLAGDLRGGRRAAHRGGVGVVLRAARVARLPGARRDSRSEGGLRAVFEPRACAETPSC